MPAAPIALGDIVQVIVGSTAFGQQALNVVYYRATGNMGPNSYAASLSDLVASVLVDPVTGIVPELLKCIGPNVTVNFVQAQKVYPVREIPLRQIAASAGQHADDCDAFNVSAVILKKSETSGRGRTGSFHVAGIPSTAYALGSLTTAYRTILSGLRVAIGLPQDSLVPGSDWRPVIYSPGMGVGFNQHEIIETAINPYVRVMRRRTVGVGI
jgi:hypothetical protein